MEEQLLLNLNVIRNLFFVFYGFEVKRLSKSRDPRLGSFQALGFLENISKTSDFFIRFHQNTAQ